MSNFQPPKLLTRLVVDKAQRISCQQPGCNHTVYADIHVVAENSKLLLLGSSCYAKRYGGMKALGEAEINFSNGRELTQEERNQLVENTEALLKKLKQEYTTENFSLKSEVTHKSRLAETITQKSIKFYCPWSWQKEGSSVAVLTAPDGKRWVRVQHKDGTQKIAPWPLFQGWESSLPKGIGLPDYSLAAYSVTNIVDAIKVLRMHGFSEPIVGRWFDVLHT